MKWLRPTLLLHKTRLKLSLIKHISHCYGAKNKGQTGETEGEIGVERAVRLGCRRNIECCPTCSMLLSLGPCLLFVGWGEENEGVVTHVALDSWSQSSVWSRVWGWRLLPSAFVSWTVLSWKPADLVLIPSRGHGLGWGHGQEWEESIKQARKQPWINHYCFITTLHPPPSALLLFTSWHTAMPNHGHLEGNFHSRSNETHSV